MGRAGCTVLLFKLSLSWVYLSTPLIPPAINAPTFIAYIEIVLPKKSRVALTVASPLHTTLAASEAEKFEEASRVGGVEIGP
ncbi:hypothetical protein GV64_07590 [Endozoicomonas elysicola]|uniref:Uncharacterized protein n=1 Tax=Endozoicomonas elysicola TaxID=305900 RepID=A0A081K8Z5_9GAMM|nr:hypothetical protein GV64_07590 [Endozoicomonas elysicola]